MPACLESQSDVGANAVIFPETSQALTEQQDSQDMQQVYAEDPAPAKRSARIAIRRVRAVHQHAIETHSLNSTKSDATVD